MYVDQLNHAKDLKDDPLRKGEFNNYHQIYFFFVLEYIVMMHLAKFRFVSIKHLLFHVYVNGNCK